MPLKSISTDKAPAAIGPYSQAISTGSILFISGQLPINPETGAFAGEDIKSQTEQSIRNLQAVLEAEGLTLSDVAKTTVFLKDIADFADMNAVYSSFFKGTCPARSAFQVVALPKGALVEIEAIAAR